MLTAFRARKEDIGAIGRNIALTVDCYYLYNRCLVSAKSKACEGVETCKDAWNVRGAGAACCLEVDDAIKGQTCVGAHLTLSPDQVGNTHFVDLFHLFLCHISFLQHRDGVRSARTTCAATEMRLAAQEKGSKPFWNCPQPAVFMFSCIPTCHSIAPPSYHERGRGSVAGLQPLCLQRPAKLERLGLTSLGIAFNVP